MIEKFTYTNHLNEVIEFGNGSLFANENELHDYSWEISKKNEKITGFTKGVVDKTIPIVISCNSEEEGLQKRNALFEICEKDVLANQHGKITIGDYYLKCFVTESSKSQYTASNHSMKVNLKITTDYPSWVKEETTMFRKGSTSEEGLEFPYDYAFDYSSSLVNKKIVNSGVLSSNFEMTVYGSASSPYIYIAGHAYGVDAEIESGEYLVVNSITKRVYKVKKNGEEVNLFNYRNRDSYIFEKIPEGSQIVSWNGNYGFDITIFDERSEPKWI